MQQAGCRGCSALQPACCVFFVVKCYGRISGMILSSSAWLKIIDTLANIVVATMSSYVVFGLSMSRKPVMSFQVNIQYVFPWR